MNKSFDAPQAADAKPIDASTAVDAPLSFSMDGGWTCAQGIDCEDIYDFDAASPTMVTVNVTALTGSSDARLGLFAGTTTSATNLFTGTTAAACAASFDTDFSQGPTLVSPGHYRVTVGRDWGQSGGAAGTYTVKITTTAGIANVSQTSDDTTSNQGHC